MKLWSRIGRARRTRKEKSRRERGAALIEFALVAPIFFAVVFGGIEVGLMARGYLGLQDVGRTAGRIAAVERNDINADLAVAQAIDNRLSRLTGNLTRVVIYNAPNLSSNVTDINMGSCVDMTNSGTPGQCTVYTGAALDALIAGGPVMPMPDGAPCGPTGSGPVDGFLPCNRMEDSFIGVYIEYDHRSVTGFFNTVTLRSDTVQVIEADFNA